jgi:hypothetical protein
VRAGVLKRFRALVSAVTWPVRSLQTRCKVEEEGNLVRVQGGRRQRFESHVGWCSIQAAPSLKALAVQGSHSRLTLASPTSPVLASTDGSQILCWAVLFHCE